MSAPELSEEELESLGRAIGEESTYCVLDCEEPGSECHWPQLRRLLDEHAALKRAQCTREERAVLDACANIPDVELMCRANWLGYAKKFGDAEWARREAARKGG